jgi:hypothetical protein
MKNIGMFLLVFLLFFNCYSKKNMTEARVRERVTQFFMLMAKDQVGEAEKLLTDALVDSGNKEFFLQNFDDWRLKDTATIVIDIKEVYIPPEGEKNKALVSLHIHSTKYSDVNKLASIPMSYERGDWYLGS